MNLVIATTLCFEPYGHVKDGEYRRKLWKNMLRSMIGCPNPSPHQTHRLGNYKWSHAVRADKEWNRNYAELLNDVSEMAEYCLIADSDGYFHPDWYAWLCSSMNKYPDAAGWALYNSPRQTEYFVRELEPGIIEKRHTCPHGLVYRTADRPKQENMGEWFETFISTLPEKHSMGFVTPQISMLQHAGCYGLNNVPGGSQDYDPLFPLNEQCGLGGYTDRTGFEEVQFTLQGETK